MPLVQGAPQSQQVSKMDAAIPGEKMNGTAYAHFAYDHDIPEAWAVRMATHFDGGFKDSEDEDDSFGF